MSLEHAFFYKSVNGDRVYDDASFEHWLKKFFTSGVFLNDLQVTANDDMTVTVGAGYVNADSKVKIFESATPLIIETAGASYPRIDSIVLERNDTERDILLKVIKGGYSSEPVAHTPVRQDGVYQLVIAQILVNAGAVKVSQADITDTRSNTELCGIVAGAVDQIDFSQIQAQFDAYFAQYKAQIATDYTQYNADMETYLDQMAEDFATWFEGIRNQLDEDAAGHLQNQIDDINARLEYAGGSIVEVTVNDNEGAYNVEGLEVNLVIDGKTYAETINDNIAKFTGVLEVGTATITCVDEAQEFNGTTSIEIPYYGAYECSMNGGATYKDWIEAGGLNPSSYESLDALLEDEAAVRTLMTKKDAVDVLARISGNDLSTIINHPYVAKWVNYREYAYSTLSAVQDIKTIMDASGMYGMYITVESDGTWQPKGLVPVMTSNTAPYGEIIFSSEYGSTKAYYVFDGIENYENDTKTWYGKTATNQYVGYKFVNPCCVKKVYINPQGSNSTRLKDYKIEASNDGTTWDELYSGTYPNLTDNITVDIQNDKYYLYYRLFALNTNSDSELIAIEELQFYGRQLEALIPPMTSNTTPIGEVTYSNQGTSNVAYKAFDKDNTTIWASGGADDYVCYEFPNQVEIKEISFSVYTTAGSATGNPHNARFYSSLDGDKWDLIASEYVSSNYTSQRTIVLETAQKTKYIKFYPDAHTTTASGTKNVTLAELQCYGTPDYESRTYIYEHGVELMELESKVTNASQKAEKRNDSLYLYHTNTSSGSAFMTSNTVDMTDYKVVRVSLANGEHGDSNNKNECVAVIIDTEKSITPTTGTSYTYSNINTIPDNICLDVTNVNNGQYVILSTYTSSSITRYTEIASWWLE